MTEPLLYLGYVASELLGAGLGLAGAVENLEVVAVSVGGGGGLGLVGEDSGAGQVRTQIFLQHSLVFSLARGGSLGFRQTLAMSKMNSDQERLSEHTHTSTYLFRDFEVGHLEVGGGPVGYEPVARPAGGGGRPALPGRAPRPRPARGLAAEPGRRPPRSLGRGPPGQRLAQPLQPRAPGPQPRAIQTCSNRVNCRIDYRSTDSNSHGES